MIIDLATPTPMVAAAATPAVESGDESDESTASELPDEGKSIYIRNLPCSVKFNEVFRLFSNVGRIHVFTLYPKKNNPLINRSIYF